jgi:ubiquinone/menaquinone biosynthesis C-methylase UbiE
MLPEEARRIADHQRRRFNELVDVFDRPQPVEVIARLQEIVSSAGLRPGEVVLDVGTGVGVLIPLIQSYQPAAVLTCDVAEKMLQRVQDKYPAVRTYHADIAWLDLAATRPNGYLGAALIAHDPGAIAAGAKS